MALREKSYGRSICSSAANTDHSPSVSSRSLNHILPLISMDPEPREWFDQAELPLRGRSAGSGPPRAGGYWSRHEYWPRPLCPFWQQAVRCGRFRASLVCARCRVRPAPHGPDRPVGPRPPMPGSALCYGLLRGQRRCRYRPSGRVYFPVHGAVRYGPQ